MKRPGYDQWLAGKTEFIPPAGIDDADLSDLAFPHQRSIIQWALRRGRAAVFADTGLGKTLIQLEWARIVSEKKGPVLILAPLAVAEQTVAEGARFGVAVQYDRTGEADTPIVITNYEMMERFDVDRFAGIVLDESSILKSFTGKYRNAIIEAFKNTPFRLACTATPAPNDFTELGNHAEFLGVKTRTEMLAEYFVHDGGSTQNWRIKGHAEEPFWMWLASWGVVIKMPSDLGYDDAGFDLPALNTHEHVVPVEHEDAQKVGLLFAPQAVSLNDQRATRRMTMERRVDIAQELAGGTDPVLVWCELNAESDACEKAIPGAVQVKGSQDHDTKADRLLGFAEGRYRVLVTKPSIAGFGMNWQHCNKMVFLGASHSYEQTYQAIRRCWRFGQKKPVDVHVVRAETEQAIVANFKRKQADAERMAVAMIDHVRDAQSGALETGARWNPYNPQVPMRIPSWVGKDAT